MSDTRQHEDYTSVMAQDGDIRVQRNLYSGGSVSYTITDESDEDGDFDSLYITAEQMRTLIDLTEHLNDFRELLDFIDSKES